MTDVEKKRLIELEKRVDAIEYRISWMTSAEQRFRKGQRVTPSRRCLRQGLLRLLNGKPRRGTVVQLDGFCIEVKLDGQKQLKKFHHAFFNPVSGEGI